MLIIIGLVSIAFGYFELEDYGEAGKFETKLI